MKKAPLPRLSRKKAPAKRPRPPKSIASHLGRKHAAVTTAHLAYSNAIDEVYQGTWATPQMAEALARVRDIIARRVLPPKPRTKK